MYFRNQVIFLLIFGFFSSCLFAQSLKSIQPDTSTQGRVLDVTITGTQTNWDSPYSYLEIYSEQGGINQNNYSILNDTVVVTEFHISQTAPTGDHTISLEYNNGSYYKTSLTNGFFVNDSIIPAILSISPNNGVLGETALDLHIYGEETQWNNSQYDSIIVDFINAPIVSGSVQIHSNTHIQCLVYIPETDITGTYSVEVKTYDTGVLQEELVLENAFTVDYPVPKIAYIQPQDGKQGETLDVTITGEATYWANSPYGYIQVMAENTNKISTSENTLVNDTTLISTWSIANNAPVGQYTVVVDYYNSSQGRNYTIRKENEFTVLDSLIPTIMGVNPDVIMQGAFDTNISIIGEETYWSSVDDSSVSVDLENSNIQISDVSVKSANELSAKVSIGYDVEPGMYKLIVEKFAGNSRIDLLTLENALYVEAAPPQLLSITPGFGEPGDNIPVTINGLNTDWQTSPYGYGIDITFSDGGINSDNTSIENSTKINSTFNISNSAQLGTRDVTVHYWNDGDGTDESYSLGNGFLVGTPTISFKIDSVTANPSDTVSVPIYLDAPYQTSIKALEMYMTQNSPALKFLGIDTMETLVGEFGWMIEWNTADSLVLHWAAGADPITHNGLLTRLKFKVNSEMGTFVPIKMDSIIVNDGGNEINITNGGIDIESSFVYGDVDGNEQVTKYDAFVVLGHVIKLDTLSANDSLAADITRDHTISALDGALILQYWMGQIDALPYDTSNGNLKAQSEIQLSDVEMKAGELVNIPLILTNTNSLISIEGIFKYDPSHLEFNKIIWNNLPDETLARYRDNSGHLEFGVAQPGYLPASKTLGNIQFRASDEIDVWEAEVTLSKVRLNENSVLTDVAVARLTRTTGITENQIPDKYILEQNHPNPFNPSTTIKFGLPENAHITLTIYDIAGREVAKLIESERGAGWHSINWTGENEFGEPVSTGVYFYRLETEKFHAIKKIIFIK
ncbi:MAG: T9SS type A sorting domain-containing protein [Candidatus Marinimicrobia bacterium]|nr:T9SS type A sorting domain-containing protein [Candidatus Neomarinimicrobiota bacterium]MCF7880204.1 T9SS type A sorting domain-containing protein [Candidatus Neomarinimicrobiota bacterium]